MYTVAVLKCHPVNHLFTPNVELKPAESGNSSMHTETDKSESDKALIGFSLPSCECKHSKLCDNNLHYSMKAVLEGMTCSLSILCSLSRFSCAL